MLKRAKTYVVPPKQSDPIQPASPNRHTEVLVRPMLAADPISPSSPICGTFDQLSETGLNTQAIVGDAMEQASTKSGDAVWREKNGYAGAASWTVARGFGGVLHGDPERARCALGAEPGTPAVAVAQTCRSVSTVEDDGKSSADDPDDHMPVSSLLRGGRPRPPATPMTRKSQDGAVGTFQEALLPGYSLPSWGDRMLAKASGGMRRDGLFTNVPLTPHCHVSIAFHGSMLGLGNLLIAVSRATKSSPFTQQAHCVVSARAVG
eukprot:6168357-Amphidinium_carterae.1